MSKIIEEKIQQCNKCNRATTHKRNNTRMGLMMFLVHVVLTIVTVGIWLALLVVYKVLTAKVGGWKCSRCMDNGVPVTLYDKLNSIKIF